MKGKYKVLGFVGLSVGLVALLLVAVVPTGSQDFPIKEIERDLRHPQGEIIELAGPLSLEECERFQEYVQEHKDDFWFVDEPKVLVGMFVQEFVYGRDLIDDILYRDIHQDGTARIGVTSRDVIEELKELGIPITFEIIDVDEVRHLEEAAREIDEKPYVLGAWYSHKQGRIRVSLAKQNWDFYNDIYREYPDSLLLFRLVDAQPETEHGGGEAIKTCRWGWWDRCDLTGTSGFLADWQGEDVMVTAGHLPDCDHLHYMKVYNENNWRVGTFEEKWVGDPCWTAPPGDDAGFYTPYSGVTFNNVISGTPSTWAVEGWAEDDPNVDDWLFYSSGFEGIVMCHVTDVLTDYFEYMRFDGAPGDSGSPVFRVTIDCGMIIHGVHTHAQGVGHGSNGFATNIDRVKELLGVSEPASLRENFEWGVDGLSLDEEGGKVDWAVTTGGSSRAEIDTGQKFRGAKSGRLYRDGENSVGAYYSLYHPSYIEAYIRTDGNVDAWVYNGDGTKRVTVRINANEKLQYYDTTWKNVCSVSAGTWYLLQLKNIDWDEGTFEIWLNRVAQNRFADMQTTSYSNGYMWYTNFAGDGAFWVDDIRDDAS